MVCQNAYTFHSLDADTPCTDDSESESGEVSEGEDEEEEISISEALHLAGKLRAFALKRSTELLTNITNIQYDLAALSRESRVKQKTLDDYLMKK